MLTLSSKLSNIRFRQPRWRHYGREHALPLLIYLLLSIALTWPTAQTFTTRLVSDGGDARNNLWMIWHVKEALLGNQPWFELDLLYYPLGVNLLTRGLGPLVGLLALPFWPFGPEAAYNGTVIVSIWLTGWTMYLLARALNFNRFVSFFAGLFLLTAPIHLAGTGGHLTKAFMALLPLVFLAFLRLLDLKRSQWWSVITAIILLLTLLHNGYQFIFACMALAFFGLAAFIQAETAEKRPILQRGLLLAAATAVLVGPLLFAILRASADPLVPVDANAQSVNFQPDSTEFFLPPSNSRLFGPWVQELLRSHGHRPAVETAVSISWTGLLLMGLAAVYRQRESRLWWLFALITAVLAAGPSLKWLGDRTFTEYQFPIILPYAFVTALPGFDFMRAPGRFMMISIIPIGIAAAYGLAWLSGRSPRYARAIVLLACLLLLAERWPGPWPRQTLRQTPEFYQTMADDPDLYGVFDLPVKPTEQETHINYAATYQMDQMTHQKGIASGYLARTYTIHPMFPCIIPETVSPQPDVMVDGETADCAANFLFDLAYFNYRYLVLHKPAPNDRYDEPDSWGQQQSAALIERFFAGQTPLVDDALVTVYAVPPLEEISGLRPTLGLTGFWHEAEPEWRWAQSPAAVMLSIPEAQTVYLELLPAFIYEPNVQSGMGQNGRLTLTLNNGYSTTVEINSGQVTAVPLQLEAGVYSLTLELEAGSFFPTDFGNPDQRRLSFALHTLNLRTTSQP